MNNTYKFTKHFHNDKKYHFKGFMRHFSQKYLFIYFNIISVYYQQCNYCLLIRINFSLLLALIIYPNSIHLVIFMIIFHSKVYLEIKY